MAKIARWAKRNPENPANPKNPDSDNGGLGFAIFWIPAFAGMTGESVGMAGLVRRLLDSRFRGNDGGECGNGGLGSPPFGFPLSRE